MTPPAREAHPASARPDDAQGRGAGGIWQALEPLSLALLAAACYLNAAHDQLFFDSIMLEKNPAVLDLGRAAGALWTTVYLPGQELSDLTFSLNRAMNESLGRAPFDASGFLVVNVALHALNVVLLHRLALGLLAATVAPSLLSSGRPPSRHPSFMRSAWLAVALFAAHPLHVSTVVYVMQRRGLLATLFTLLALLGRLRWRGESARPRRWGALVIVVIGCWLSCKSKAMGVVVVPALIVLELCLRATDGAALRRALWAAILAGLIFALALLGYVAARDLFDWRSLRFRSSFATSPWTGWQHFLTESRVWAHYWKLILLPLPRWMTIDHQVPVSNGLFEHQAWLAILFHACLIAAAVRAARRGWRLAGFGVMLFYVALIPYACLPQPELMVEYKTYLSAVGVCLVFVEWLDRWGRRSRAWMPAAVVAPCILLLAGTTLGRNLVYRDPVLLWSEAVAAAPQNARARNYLGTALKNAGRLDEAVEEFKAALRIIPDWAEVENNLANALANAHRLGEAAAMYRQALLHNPGLSLAHLNLALTYQKLGRLTEAVEEYHAGLSIYPRLALPRRNLAAALSSLGRLTEAQIELRQVLREAPNDAEAHLALGSVLETQGKLPEATEEFREALRLDPRLAEAASRLKALTGPR